MPIPPTLGKPPRLGEPGSAYDPNVRGMAKAGLQLLALAAGVAVATVAFDFLGYVAAVVASVLLLIAVLYRSWALALILGLGAAIFLALLFRNVCNGSIQGCSPLPETAIFMVWLGVLAVGGIVAAILVRLRTQTA
jgi:hypothetical protein